MNQIIFKRNNVSEIKEIHYECTKYKICNINEGGKFAQRFNISLTNSYFQEPDNFVVFSDNLQEALDWLVENEMINNYISDLDELSNTYEADLIDGSDIHKVIENNGYFHVGGTNQYMNQIQLHLFTFKDNNPPDLIFIDFDDYVEFLEDLGLELPSYQSGDFKFIDELQKAQFEFVNETTKKSTNLLTQFIQENTKYLIEEPIIYTF